MNTANENTTALENVAPCLPASVRAALDALDSDRFATPAPAMRLTGQRTHGENYAQASSAPAVQARTVLL